MHRLSALILMAGLSACDGTVEDAESVAYEGRSQLTVAPDAAVEEEPSLDGRYGASAADCDRSNRYMTEYLEIDGDTLTYRGERRAISQVGDDEVRLHGGERLQRTREGLVRWPDQRRKRTVYSRCP